MSVESEHVDISPTSEKHKAILERVIEREKFSARKMRDYQNRWDLQDETVRAYLPETELSTEKKNKKRFKRDFDYISLELPYSFAIVMTAHTYWSSVFLSRNPVYQFTARHGEPQDKVMAVEAIMDYQLSVGRHLPTLYNWLYDFSKYGLGIVGDYWDRDEVTVARFVEEPVTLFGVPVGDKTQKVRKEQRVTNYDGNKLFNIRPHDFRPDPRVPLHDFQSGEFCGRIGVDSYGSLQAAGYINIEAAQKAGKGRGAGSTDIDGSAQVDRAVQPEEEQGPGVGYARILEMHLWLVPSNWGLGDSNQREKWVITVANSNTIIGCRPLGLYHNQFPYSVIEYGMGSEEFVKLSMIDIMRPLTDTLSWLFNVHFFNVRKALNDTRVVDPSRIDMSDVLRPGAGGVIKLKPEAYGTDPKDAIHQLQVMDVTRTHLQDTSFVEAMVQRVTGVVDNLMGMVHQGGRKTATEVRTSTGFSTNRLQTPAEYASACGWAPLTQRMLMNTQQIWDGEQQFRAAGSLALEGNGRPIEVTPDMLAGFFDFVPVDGTMPVDRLAQANFWKEMIVQVSRAPQLAMEWDLGQMMAHAMKLVGERNVDRFHISISPDEKMAAQQQAGNVVALGGRDGTARGGNPPEGTSGGLI